VTDIDKDVCEDSDVVEESNEISDEDVRVKLKSLPFNPSLTYHDFSGLVRLPSHAVPSQNQCNFERISARKFDKV